MTSLISRIDKQERRITAFNALCDTLQNRDITESDKVEIQVLLSTLESEWLAIQGDHDKIHEGKFNTLKLTDYYIQDIFSTARTAYLKQKIQLATLLKKLNTLSSLDGSLNNETNVTHSASSFPSRVALPKLQIPVFDGDYRKWRPFYDAFSSLVGSDHDIPPMMKMHYLKGSLIRDAARLINNYQITRENYELAWTQLVDRFENKRLLTHRQVEIILRELKPLKQRTAKGLAYILDTFQQAVQALKVLGSPTQTWDDILVCQLSYLLDPETKQAWSLSLGATTTPPKLDKLVTFIQGHIRAFEEIDISHHQQLKLKSRESPQHNKSFTTAANNNSRPCPVCNGTHLIHTCSIFLSKTHWQRMELIKKFKRCLNCFNSHYVSSCRSTKNCHTCGKPHHTLLHYPQPKFNNHSTNSNEPSTSNPTSNLPPNDNSSTAVSHHFKLHDSKVSNTTLLATAKVLVQSPSGYQKCIRILIDPGSEVSLICNQIVKDLRLRMSKTNVSLFGVGNTKSTPSNSQVYVRVQSLTENHKYCWVNCLVLPNLTSKIPSAPISQTSWPHIQSLNLADPDFITPSKIDMILGADIYSSIMMTRTIKGPHSTPLAQLTIFGWILSGPTTNSSSTTTRANSFHTYIHHEENLNQLMQRFWIQEEVPDVNSTQLSSEEIECEQHFLSTVERDQSGRYVVQLPFKCPPVEIGNSYHVALSCLTSLKRKFSLNPIYSQLYTEFITEYERLNYCSKIPNSINPMNELGFYLPHHGILKESSLTTKLRVVFNGSCHTAIGLSLNQAFHTGTKLQSEIIDVLLWFRQFKFVFVTDIEKMYRQINLHKDHCGYQKILWFDKSDKLITYQLQTVTYGLACAPFQALRVLKQLIIDEGHNFPLAVPIIEQGRYVDDLFGGADTIKECVDIAKETTHLCNKGCFPLNKWMANDPQILNHIQTDFCSSAKHLIFDNSESVKTLGLLWNKTSDSFCFTINFQPLTQVTKRSILSQVARIFDPLGLVSPLIIQAKLLIQELWLQKLDWDEIVPHCMITRWKQFENQLNTLTSLSFPRYLGILSSSTAEIHGFADASNLAMSAVIYLKVISPNAVTTQLLISKTKVAPLKRLSIPRLELTAAVLLTKLVKYITPLIRIPINNTYLWSDSSATISWITSHPSKWKDYIRNRVCFIQTELPSGKWRYISTKQNPADCASRGMTIETLMNHSTWFTGPPWISLPESNWPASSFKFYSDISVEQRHNYHIHSSSFVKEPTIFSRYSELHQLVRTISWCYRFIHITRNMSSKHTFFNFLTPVETHQSLRYLIKIAQELFYKEEMKLISTHQVPLSTNILKNCNPFIDSDGLLRVGGRLELSEYAYNTKHPIILHKSSRLTALIIKDAHLRSLHGGVRLTLGTLRQDYWIPGGRCLVKKLILTCFICAKLRAQLAQQLM